MKNMFKRQSYKFDLTNNNNKMLSSLIKIKSVSTWQSGEFDRTISFKDTNSSIDLVYTL